jgi:hypothetical protein
VYRWFSREVLGDFDIPIPSGPYPNDTLVYRSNAVVEYTTPARTEGLGNLDSWIGKNDLPITGAAILHIDPAHMDRNIPHLMVLSVRLPRDLARLSPTIVRCFERDAATRH